MAFLSTALFSAATIAEPTWMWEKLLLHVFDFIGNYGWRVVVFTLILKLVLSPLDIYQRIAARKNQRITERIKPQLEKLQKQYPDQQVYARKQMELQKKEGFSYFSSCLPAIITLAVMFSLLGALNEVSQYMNFKEYYELYNVYNEAVVEYDGLSESEKAALRDSGLISDSRTGADGVPLAADIQYGQNKVYDYYQDNKTSFLWIKNIWSPDVPWKKEVNNFSQWQANVGNKRANDAGRSGISDEELQRLKAQYPTVMGKLVSEEYNGANGYLVLPILSVLLSVATQLIAQRQQKLSGQANDAMGGGSMKVMMFIMPIMIGWFSLSYTSAFALYLVVSYAFSLLINLASSLIIKLIDRKEKRKLETEVHKYGRPDPNDL